MSDFTGIIIVIIAILCMFLAQGRSTPKPTRRLYAFLGSAASIMIAVEAARRGELNISALFATAAAFSLIGMLLDYLKPTKPDA